MTLREHTIQELTLEFQEVLAREHRRRSWVHRFESCDQLRADGHMVRYVDSGGRELARARLGFRPAVIAHNLALQTVHRLTREHRL